MSRIFFEKKNYPTKKKLKKKSQKLKYNRKKIKSCTSNGDVQDNG